MKLYLEIDTEAAPGTYFYIKTTGETIDGRPVFLPYKISEMTEEQIVEDLNNGAKIFVAKYQLKLTEKEGKDNEQV